MSDELVSEERKDYSQAERDTMAKNGQALPDGSFPIADTADLKNAIGLVGNAGNKAAAKAHVIKRAKALGATGMLPEDWRSEDEELEERDTGIRERLRGTLEHRRFSTEAVEIRSTSDGGLRFSGYASTTETPYKVGGFEETFARGAFKRCLGEDPDVVLLVNHEGLPLARTKSGTMTLSEDARGLKVQADLDADDPDVQSLVPKMRRGDLTEMSFAFRATDDEWSERDTKRLVRSATIHKGDVSVVTHGANSATSVGIRSLVEEFEQRAGKRNSKQDRAEIEDTITKLQSLLEPDDTEPTQQQELKVELVPRSSVEWAKTRRRKLGRRP